MATKTPTTEPKKEAYLGSGSAEKARQAIKSRGSRIDAEEDRALNSYKAGGMVRRGYGSARGA